MKMKEMKWAWVLAVALVMGAPMAAWGAAGSESLSVTSVIAVATEIIGAPTNTSGYLTGRGVNVDNYTQVGITLTGAGTIGGVTNIGNATSNNIVIELVRSSSGASPPSNTEWSASVMSIKVPVNGTTQVNWHTNLEAWFVGPARYIGVGRMTNSCSSGAFSNATLTLTKKIIPITWP